MTADIQKGSRIDLTKTRPDLSQLAIRISWESPDSYDIDAAVFMADQNGHCPDDSSMIFYGNSVSTDQSVQHSVVAETGRSTEIFHINLPLITPSIEKLVFTLTIYEGDKKNQTFSEMNNASILFSNAATGEEAGIFYD
jgi:tellurite resistance protein TerA